MRDQSVYEKYEGQLIIQPSQTFRWYYNSSAVSLHDKKRQIQIFFDN